MVHTKHTSQASFLRSSRGNIAMMFGLLMAPIFAAVGFGIDMSRNVYVQQAVAEAADAGALAAARARLSNQSMTLAQAQTIARKAFDLNTQDLKDVTISSFSLDFDPDTEAYSVTAKSSLEPNFIKIAGIKSLESNIFSEVQASPPRALELVMALDNTGSMSGTKLSTLKTAATNLSTDLMNASDTVKIGLVPFSNYVNVGLSRRNAPWIDVPADQSNKEYKCRNTYPDLKKSNCRTETRTCTRTNDGVKTTYPCEKTKCDVDKGKPVEKCGWKTTTQKWRGCVGSRDSVFDEIDGDYATRKIPGLLNRRCSEELLPLTSTLSEVTGKIDSMSAKHETYIPAGLAWGRRVLSSQAPFTEGVTYAKARADRSLKVLIIMTDGENTKSANYPRHEASSKAIANTKTRSLCESIKDDGIVIYSIAFEVTDLSTKSILQDCASSSKNYFDATDATKLIAVFDEIGNSLQDLALTR
ncbi:MAG: pilus assembly protein TadG-related protein [Pseudomonadota bacterium]